MHGSYVLLAGVGDIRSAEIVLEALMTDRQPEAEVCQQ